MKSIFPTLILLFLISCTNKEVTSNFKMDHVNIWVQDPVATKEKLIEIGFTAIPDSLCVVHAGQGTTGRYFYFLNSYLELIFQYDEEEFNKNVAQNGSLDFKERWENEENGYSPFSVAMKMIDYDKGKIPFETIDYYQEWMGDSNTIQVAKNSKIQKEEPSLFIIFPEIKFDEFENVDSLIRIPEEYAIWREFHKHPNGAEKITEVKIHSKKIDHESETIKTLNGLEKVNVLEGEEYLMEITFDDNVQDKMYDLRPVLPLRIYL